MSLLIRLKLDFRRSGFEVWKGAPDDRPLVPLSSRPDVLDQVDLPPPTLGLRYGGRHEDIVRNWNLKGHSSRHSLCIIQI